MLDELRVRNLGVIADAHVEPGQGMVVFTGETGAGKTMLLGALRLLIGGTAKNEAIGPDGDEAAAEARFVFEDDEVVATRRLAESRSRAYLDGGMVAARALEDRLSAHVEIVGQHDQLLLLRPREVRRLVDRRLDDPSAVDRYRAAWERFSELRLAQERLGGDRRALERERDLVSFQVDEIEDAGFEPGDDEVLEASARRLQHAERIAELTSSALEAFSIAREGAGSAVSALRQAAELDGGLEELVGAAEAIDAELAEAAAASRHATESIEHEPSALEAAERRLTLLGDLRRKYGATLDEILEFQAAAAERHAELTELLERAASIDADLTEAQEELNICGSALRAARAEAAARVAGDAIEHLNELGFGDPHLEITVVASEPAPDGADHLQIEFASDRRLTPGPVAKVASGGELSRLVLSLRLASGAGAASVVAFDEIDTGVGGTTALAMGEKLARLAGDRQVLCVTHLPQVAAFADRHYVVDRDGATAEVRQIDGDDRLEELSRMLSGLPDSEHGRVHAEELRDLARQARA